MEGFPPTQKIASEVRVRELSASAEKQSPTRRAFVPGVAVICNSLSPLFPLPPSLLLT